MPKIIRCPHCDEELDQLDYTASYSETVWGRTSGTYSFSGSEDEDECASGETDCSDTDQRDADNFEEEDFTYSCPYCNREVEPEDCVIDEDNLKMKNKDNFLYEEGEMVTWLGQNRLGGDRIQTDAKIIKRKTVKNNDGTKTNVYTIHARGSLLQGIPEDHILKIGITGAEWTFNTKKNSISFLTNIVQGRFISGTEICPHCQYMFIVNENAGSDSGNQCPQCSTLINDQNGPYAQATI